MATEKPVEHRVKEIFANVLGITWKINFDDRFRDLGADSMDVCEIVSELETEFGLEIEDDLVDKWNTVGDVIRYVRLELPITFTQEDVDAIVARAKELGAGPGLTHKQGHLKLSSYGEPAWAGSASHADCEWLARKIRPDSRYAGANRMGVAGPRERNFMKINTVTVTGADESIRPIDLIEIVNDFPFVEFGILISRGHRLARFPGSDWIKELREILPRDVKLAAHVCGSWVREILQGNWPEKELEDLLGPDYLRRFGRWQLNTHGVRHAWTSKFITSIECLPYPTTTIIFQYDGANNEVVDAARQSTRRIAALFDLSHGAGILPNAWPAPLHGIYCGYAGGLSPSNVRIQAARIEAKIGADDPTWIDAETHLRSHSGQFFDLGKVREFLFNASIGGVK